MPLFQPSGFQLISETDMSGITTWEAENIDSYSMLLVTFKRLDPATNGASIVFYVSDDLGATTLQWTIASAIAAGLTLSGSVLLINGGKDGGLYPNIFGSSSSDQMAVANVTTPIGYRLTDNLNSILIAPSSSNFTAGSIMLEGIR